jgi:hypothetical protein
MKAISKDKGFDCIEMKNTIQTQIYAETKGMTFEELKAYIGGYLQGNSFWERIQLKNRGNTK